MKFFKNIALMLLVNVAIVATLSIVLSLLGISPQRYGNQYDLQSLAIFCLVWGMGASFISLLMSKFIAKMMMGVKIVPSDTHDPKARWLLGVVNRASERAGLPKMPEVGIYESPEMNAFATGPSRGNALVAVSTGLLTSMREEEVEGVIGHEIAHVANGDMVTMTLLQGVVNALVMFVARIIAMAVSNAVEERNRYMVRFMVITVAEIVLGIFGVMITAAFSRHREFRADAGGATFMGREKMISALEALRDRQRYLDNRAPELQTFKISSKSGGFLSLMMSHPPLDRRIDALRRGSYAG